MAKLQRSRISRRTVNNLSVEKDTVFWDMELPGFGVRAYASGSKVYVVQTRATGRSRRLTIEAVDYERVAAVHSRMYRVPSMANRMVETFSAMLSMAETWGLRPANTNPCRRVIKYKRKARERLLTEAEFERLGRTLNELEAEGKILPRAAAALRLLMLTGCRCNEILRLRWDEVDLERNELRLADSKTGRRTVPLSPAGARVLADRPRVPGDPWVIPGRFPGKPFRNIDRSWRKVRERADLEDVRLHDLRHSFASRALALGESLPMIGRLLGHRRIQSTARYVHLAPDAAQASAERIARSVAGDLGLDWAEG